MKIEKNWFYKLSELNSDKITIEDDLVVTLFDDLTSSQPSPSEEKEQEQLNSPLLQRRGFRGEVFIEIWENSRVELYSIFESLWQCNTQNTNVWQCNTGSKLKIRCLLLSKDNNKIKSKIYSELSADFTKSDIHIISIVWNDWFVDLDWIIQINEWIKKVEANLIEENLFLWNSWKVKWIPTLLVRSDDVKASHSCKMERISDEKLFYLRSRWVGKENALNMMIEAKIKSLFAWISIFDKDFYEKLIENIIKKVK